MYINQQQSWCDMVLLTLTKKDIFWFQVEFFYNFIGYLQ